MPETALTTLGKGQKGKLKNPASVISDSKEASKLKIDQFPSNLGMHQFLMQFVKYTFSPEKTNTADTEYSVAFPIPITGMIDKHDLRYNSTDLGVMGAGASSMVDKIKENFDASGQPEKSTAGTEKVDFKQLVADGIKAGAALGRGMLGAEIGGGIDQALGNTVNPQVALLFQGVNLKTFTFTWKFAPDNLDQSIKLKNIIKKIKSLIYPNFVGANGGNLYLEYPSQVDLFYMGSADHMHYFKRAACTAMEVNYAPDGAAFMENQGAPAIIDVTMTFQESEIWTGGDFE
jgi:hypothetical protein|tara:strand:- start:8404 stop:9270 length:867 start_codon:yes stop_codon:yes gene_type:complete